MRKGVVFSGIGGYRGGDKPSNNDKKKGKQTLKDAPKGSSADVPQSKKTLDDAPAGSSIMYLAWLDLPPPFLQAIEALCEDLSKRLKATKIGASSSVKRFLGKMSLMQLYFPFATLKYRAFIVPPELKVVVLEEEFELDGFVAESAFHYLFMSRLIMGEWFDLDDEMKQRIETKLFDNIQGCFYVDLTTEFPRQNLEMPQKVGPKGWVYFASFEWSQDFINAITSVGEDGNQKVKNTCDDMLAVKVGCAAQIVRSTEKLEELLVDYDSDQDVDDDEEERYENG